MISFHIKKALFLSIYKYALWGEYSSHIHIWLGRKRHGWRSDAASMVSSWGIELGQIPTGLEKQQTASFLFYTSYLVTPLSPGIKMHHWNQVEQRKREQSLGVEAPERLLRSDYPKLWRNILVILTTKFKCSPPWETDSSQGRRRKWSTKSDAY